MPIKQICLDLDGVLCDFIGPTLRLFGHDPEVVFANWPAGTYDVAAVIGVSTNDLWRTIDKAGFHHWADLPKNPWADDLLTACREIAPTIILTSPSRHISSLSGKLAWLQRHYGRKFRDYLIGPPKHFCANADTVLIDDCDKNCEEFRVQGGEAIVFPQHWNSMHIHRRDAMGYVEGMLMDHSARL